MGDQSLLRRVLAFHYCANSDALNLAKKSVEVLIHVLQNLFEVELERLDFTPADIEARARKMYDFVSPETITLGLYFAEEFGVFGGRSWNTKTSEIISLQINESIVSIKSVEGAWDDLIRRLSVYVDGDKALEMSRETATTNPDPRDTEPSASQGLVVLISHSSKDAKLAFALIEVLRAGLGLLANQIRCSSVDGYRLPGGVNTDAQLKVEVNAARVLVGLVTPNSLVSPYVLFELGARWGAGLFMMPLSAGVNAEDVRGPLSGLNTLSCSIEAQLHQFLEEVAKELGLPLQSPASYSRYVSELKKMSDAILPSATVKSSAQEEVVFEESVYWKYKNGQRQGPYCPVCYDDKRKAVHLNLGAAKGKYSCGVCRNTFSTSEFIPRPARRRPYSSR